MYKYFIDEFGISAFKMKHKLFKYWHLYYIMFHDLC